MNKLNIEPFSFEKAKIEVVDENAGLRIMLLGRMDFVNPSKIFGTYFDDIHKKIVQAGIDHIKLDFTKLEFFNSSAIKLFIRWLAKLARGPENQKYKVTIIYDPEKPWQETGLTPFKYLAPEIIELTTE